MAVFWGLSVLKTSWFFVFLGTRELNELIGDDGSDADISIDDNDDDNDFRVVENAESYVENLEPTNVEMSNSLFVEESNFFVTEGELHCHDFGRSFQFSVRYQITYLLRI